MSVFNQQITEKIKQSYLDRVHVLENGCWKWIGSNNGSGYGEIRILNKKIYAHRYFYEQLKDKIPDGLVIDHLCRNRSCVNPDHLEPVTQKINCQRGDVARPHPEWKKEFCSQGHLLDENNRYHRPDGKGDNCVKCVRIRAREYARRKFGYKAKI